MHPLELSHLSCQAPARMLPREGVAGVEHRVVVAAEPGRLNSVMTRGLWWNWHLILKG